MNESFGLSIRMCLVSLGTFAQNTSEKETWLNSLKQQLFETNALERNQLDEALKRERLKEAIDSSASKEWGLQNPLLPCPREVESSPPVSGPVLPHFRQNYLAFDNTYDHKKGLCGFPIA